ncbi:MAG: phospholipid carrier-dependent glycosyltransferase [Gammaproteobacteria bacterium]
MPKRRLYKNASHTWWTDALFLTLILGSLFFLFLGVRPLFVPDEGRYAEIGREMAATGDYITPYLNGIKYFEKPALFYWLGAIAIKLGGLNLWAIRSINAALGILGCLLTYAISRQLYDRFTGLLAALILGTSTLYFVMSHMVSLDLPVTLFLAASLYAFLSGVQQPPSIKRRLLLWGCGAAAALAVLTKGLIGLVFPGMIIAAWIACTRQWRLLLKLYLPSTLIVFLLIAAPWHYLVSIRNPEFFYFYFIEQHFLRYTTMDVGHYQPVWFFLPTLLAGFFPWIVFLPQSLTLAIRRVFNKSGQYQTELFFLLWAILVFVFFSFSKSKLIPYILPVFPPLAILTARYLVNGIQHSMKGIKIGYACLAVFAILFTVGCYLFTRNSPLPNPTLATFYLSLASGILLIGSGISCSYACRNTLKAIILTIVTTWLFLATLMACFPAIDARSIRPLTTILLPILKPENEVITLNQYYQDLPYYLNRTVSITNWRNELTYGLQHQAAPWMINDAEFWQRWHSDKRVFVILSRDELEKLRHLHPKTPVYILGKTINNALITNQITSKTGG